ncbi:hypothetical protein GCM10009665_12540 [Kitasatospora nipponensis]|uniref:Copper(I)-binding protein n=1 Tax=Kitasatospora nipponensis TaxID=258049 RepID=A0ABN1VUB1_9ACTN
MSRSLRRGGTAAIVLTLAAVSLSACSTGNSAETLQVKPDTPATSLGDLKLNNITLVTDPMQANGQPGPANLTVNISNTAEVPETLQSVTVGDSTATFADASGAALPGGIVIPARGAVLVGGAGQPTAHVSAVTLKLGGFAPTSFAFSISGKVASPAQVFPAIGYYAPYAPTSASASASASTSASASAGASSPAAVPPSPAASGSASASTSASASSSASASASASGSASPSSASPSASASAH